MFNTDFEYLIDEYMVYCKSRQLREKTLISYEQALRLFQRWCKEEMKILDVLDITESVILGIGSPSLDFIITHQQ